MKLAYRDPLKRALVDMETRDQIVKDLSHPRYNLGLSPEEIDKAVEQIRKYVEEED